ncbi:hypothetical protein [Acinetobacter entericus]|uniref:Uncharacterized protein n=1 Tax=Acinetobacter entericus TaxID=2989714 RepID=A0ABT3NEG9_9GAMM|nr:hypothetical protein [Acinetobacter entericus]MCW8037955.1 hypothetical protein [Acinetobacter entericus]
MSDYIQKIAPDGVMGAAIETVMDQMDKLDSVALRYRNEMSDVLSKISDVKFQPVESPQLFRIPDTPVPDISFDDRPQFSSMPLKFPELPVFHDIDALLNDLNLSEIEMPAAPAMPAIQLPDMPSMAAVEMPQRPDIDADIQLPDAPVLTLPEMDQLIQISIPEFSFPELPDFNGVPPSMDSIAVPNVFINWTTPKYSSELLDGLQAKIRAGMNDGGTGLPDAVQDALFNRSRTRQSNETDKAVQEVIHDWSARNFNMPQGQLAKQIAAIRENGRLDAADLNRDILIEASKWEIENMRFIVEKGMALEQMTMNLFSDFVNRMFEVAKFNAESQISVFNAQVALFNSQNEAFKTLTDVYKTKIEGALAKLNAYKTAVDAQVAIGQINEQYVQVFKAKIDSVLSSVELYKAAIQGASARSELIKTQFDAYKTEVQAVSEKIAAEKIKVESYEAQTRAETAKVGMFEANARAYAATIQGLQAKSSVRSDGIRLKMEAAKTWISKYAADIDGYKAGIQASLSEVQQNTSAFSAQVEAWRAAAGLEVSNAEMQSRFADMNTQTNIAYSQMQISEFQAKIQQATQQAQIALDSVKSVGQFTSQLAAGAMSAAHVSASISGSGSASTSTSSSTSDSKSESHNYNY